MTIAPAPADAPAEIERLGGRTVLSNPFIRVDTDEVRFPNGDLGEYSTVTVAEGKGVLAIPVRPFRGHPYFGFVRQYRYPVKAATLELPRGGSDDFSVDEVARELVEETGLLVSRSELLGIIHPDTGILSNEVAVWYIRTPNADELPSHREEETGAILQWYSHGEITGLVKRGEITCGLTIAALGLLTASGLLSTTYGPTRASKTEGTHQ